MLAENKNELFEQFMVAILSLTGHGPTDCLEGWAWFKESPLPLKVE